MTGAAKPGASGGSDTAGVIAPPPLIYAGFLLLGLALGYVWPMAIFGADLPPVAVRALAAALAAIGVAIGIAGFLQFRRAGTEVRPDRPTTALVETGLYRYSRNPLYVAQAFIYAGLAVAADNWWALVLLLPTMMLIRYGVVAREEAYLERKFGEAYRAYKSRVRRWL